ncbi:hypothetical protein [Halorussus sp. MSC15.2]|uniref:hypothetical protein n=1 Tax=Halorussus sp. MSC15.2 TaxID=2283638 RepID=UPI0013D7762B|nr:hypothetical protein [Halorussus sp. MSC15.2]NEU55424.1 hypothetical protein [Halorussus sp. MSC15.2]
MLVGDWFLAEVLADDRDAADPYAPPERLQGDVTSRKATGASMQETDAASVAGDVYRVGALAYHLLTGAIPGPNPATASSANPALPAELDPVLDRALVADPADRYETALAFDDEFRWAALDR